MKNLKHNFLKLSGVVLSVSILLSSCGASMEDKRYMEESAKEKAMADSVAVSSQSSPLNKTPKQADSSREFVRTADMQFKVKDVKTATFDIERIVSDNKGYVISSVLESNVNYKNSVRTGKDSMTDIINYTVHNDIIIRVPNQELDKTLSEIAAHIDYLDFRKLKANDVTKQFIASAYAEDRFNHHKERVEQQIDTKGKKLNQTVEAENSLLEKQSWADESKLNTMELKHDIAFSTITIAIYQKETTKKEAYAYAFPSEPYKPGFGTKLMDSLSDSVSILSEILLFFVKLWPIALLVIGIIALIKLVLRQKWFA
ncbi:MAG: DUF4349 domain-containing protein [Bacteroidota bacterium]